MSDSKPPPRTGDVSSLIKLPADRDNGGRRERGGKVTAGVPLTAIVRPRLVSARELVAHRRSSAGERFRRLAEMLDASRPEPPRSIVVTSASFEEGKSLVAVNLALALSVRDEGPVLLLDANMRRPTIGQWISPPPRVGLAELLSGRTDLEHVLLELQGSRLHVLGAGAVPDDAHELLVSERFAELHALVGQRFARVVIDTPPIVPFVDADLVARFSDGVLVVARAGLTSRGPLLRAISSVTAAPVLGTVLNDVSGTDPA